MIHVGTLPLAVIQLKIPLSEIMYKNIKKLEKRFGDKFSEKDALIRSLDSEREILDSMIDE